MVIIGGQVKAAGITGSVYAHPPDRETAELLGYTVLPRDGRLVASAPGGLRPGNRALTFMLEVERVIDMGNHLHVIGTIENERVDLRLPAGVAPPLEGSSLKVHAASDAVTLRD